MSAKPDQFNDFPPDPRAGRESLGWKVWQKDHSEPPRQQAPKTESGQCCAYNQTAKRFLSVDVEAGDFTPASLRARLQNLSPNEGKVLRIVPFRGISATSVIIPLDLLYLDGDCIVIEAVESFPLSRVSASSRPAASVLVLPPQSIASTGTRRGDQLIFRTPAEIKLILNQLSRTTADPTQSRSPAPTAPKAENQNSAHSPGQVLPWKDPSRPQPSPIAPGPDVTPLDFNPLDVASDTEPLPLPDPAPEFAAQAEQSTPKKKNWLERFLSTDPKDKRGALRQAIPGLTAFFFTGGTPVPHGISNVSQTGIYVMTDERWYPGTVVRMTLTDQRQPTAERSFTVNAMVIRWGNDGVGLHFIFQDKKDRKRSKLTREERAMGVADAASFKEFLKTLRGPEIR
jgi:hypothetical protein